ncbi:N-acylneuraminate-9-phosphatase like protein [Argiope bruennichi]|uniref:N-acylneuraminate-9-phosphatase like protein n=1 Tax=Argiope bruennichi TaxID=94029 RepID=A0A8T0FZC0_ARGBR|nr:N-acylneuraminate-9-phosphatase like protein [Argiope bruennichi]
MPENPYMQKRANLLPARNMNIFGKQWYSNRTERCHGGKTLVSQYLQSVGVRRSTAQDVAGKFYHFVRDTPQNPGDEDGDVDAWRLLLWKQALGPGLATRAMDCYSRWREVRACHLRLSPEIHDFLLQLRQHYKLGVVTNGPSSSQWEKIRRVPSNLFDAIVVSGDIHQKKPCPAIFEEAFRRLDSAAEECAMIGDRLDTDIAGAQNANCGVTVLLCPDGTFCREEDGPQPDYVISHLRELLDLLPDRKGFSFLCQNRTLNVFHSLREDVPAWNIS